MQPYLRTVTLSILLLFAGACSSAPVTRYSAVAPLLPRLAKNRARVFIYRADPFGLKAVPEVRLDGKRIGGAAYGEYFYADARPGKHTLSVHTKGSRKSRVTLKKGEVKYFRIGADFGAQMVYFFAEESDSKTAIEQMDKLAYSGPEANKIRKSIAAQENADIARSERGI